MYERSAAMRARVVDLDPQDVQARERLGYEQVRVAKVHRLRGDIRAALAPAREAVRVQQGVFDVTKDHTTRMTLAFAWLELGLVESAAPNREAACRAFRRALELYGPKGDWPQIPEPMRGAEQAAREAAACDARRE